MREGRLSGLPVQILEMLVSHKFLKKLKPDRHHQGSHQFLLCVILIPAPLGGARSEGFILMTKVIAILQMWSRDLDEDLYCVRTNIMQSPTSQNKYSRRFQKDL